jgi:hypothetical protein
MANICAFKDCSRFEETVHNVVCPRCKTVPRETVEIDDEE